ncbi:hypothetical protein [Gracilimonas sp.]|uniref:hypothetical protein n=1 Tax=Gracilimonas sp. TaxID=1974203 RepID=UPI0032EEFD37
MNRLIILVLLLLPAKELLAQIEGASQSRSGSFYSLFGVGFPTDNNNTRELGLGILGVSLDNMDSNSLQNPALWGKNFLTTASTGFNLSQFRATGSSSKSVNQLLEAGYLQVTFPVIREKLGISGSVYSVTRSNYRFVNIDSTVSSPDNVINYASDVRGAGGINKIEAGIGWTINKNISVGYAPSLTFISQNNSEDVFFSQSGYTTSNSDSKVTGTTIGHRFGALFSFNNLFRSNDRISLGASATLPITIDAQEKTTVTKFVNGQEQEVPLRGAQEGEITLPLEINAGLTYYPTSLVNFSLEGLYEQWSDYESAFDPNSELSYMSDRIKAGLGAEYHPYRTNSSSFWSNFRYGGGISYDSGHLNIEGQDISTLWFSAGLGIISPDPRSRSSVDISIRYGLRGTTNNNLIREKIWALNLSINLSELMFFRQKLN